MALQSELLEFSLALILDYAAAESSYNKTKRAGAPPPKNAVHFLQRSAVFHNKCPFALDKLALPREIGTYTFQTENFEMKASADSLLLSFLSRSRGSVKRGTLLSINVTDDECGLLFDEIRFITHRLKRCAPHFHLSELSLSISIDSESNTVTTTLKYDLLIRPLFFRYFSPDVSGPFAQIVKKTAIEEQQRGEYEGMAIDDHLFYKIITDKTQKVPPEERTYHHPHLLTELLPFQRRSVAWLLKREGVEFNGKISEIGLDLGLKSQLGTWPNVGDDFHDKVRGVLNEIVYGWKKVIFRGQESWFNEYTGNLMSEEQIVAFLKEHKPEGPNCGLLSEEMGLGKTVEIMSLVLLHPRPEDEVDTDTTLQLEEGEHKLVKKAKTTLICAPELILKQWYSELSRLCPSLLVTIYKGMGKYPELANVPKYINEYLRRFDIVLMNFATMSRETDYAAYSLRHASTRGQKRRNVSEEPKKEKKSTIDDFKAEFNLPMTPPSQKQKDKAILDEIAYKVKQRDPSRIPHTDFYESPLMISNWWRVVLDEVQILSSGASRAFKTASLIPRHHSWGVSGTPARLLAVLQFLKVSPFDYPIAKASWKKLTELASNHDFVNVFSNIAFRHTKAMVHDDIKLPPQRRVLLTVPFTKVEQDKYDQLYLSCIGSLGIQNTNELTALECVHLRSWLVRIRQTCGNLQIGSIPKAKGKNKSKFLMHGLPDLKTLETVLDEMVAKALDEISDGEREVINKVLDVAQFLEYLLWPTKVITVLMLALKETTKLIEAVTSRIKSDERTIKKTKGSVKQEDSDSEVDTKSVEPLKKEHLEYKLAKESLVSGKAKLRLLHMLQHKCFFLIGSAYFQLHDEEYTEKVKTQRSAPLGMAQLEKAVVTEPLLPGLETAKKEEGLDEADKAVAPMDNNIDTDKKEQFKELELFYYDAAEKCRSEILEHSLKDVASTTARRLSSRDRLEKQHWVNDGEVSFSKSKKLIVSFPQIKVNLSRYTSNIKAHQLMEKFGRLIGELNAQAEVITTNLESLVLVLSSPVLSNEKSPDGEEYEQSIQDQERASCLMLILAQLLADRAKAVSFSKLKLTELQEQRERELKAEAQRVTDKKFLKHLKSERTRCRPQSESCFEELMQEARVLEREFEDDPRTRSQAALFGTLVAVLTVVFENEKSVENLLQKELNSSYNAVFNSRVEYFKQLQQISDSVKYEEVDPSRTDTEANRLLLLFVSAQSRLTRSVSRFRYLSTLIPDKAKLEENDCVICHTAITVGVLTPCGHKFCKACLDEWLLAHSTCPICKAHTTKDTIYHFTHHEYDVKVQPVGHTHVNSVYKEMDAETLAKIQLIELKHLYGSKVDLIVRHTIHLLSRDPDVQIVLFSQWQDLLVILAFAFDIAGISYASAKGLHVAQYKGRKEDPVEEFKKGKSCFLLNAQAQASGLNLANATHMFLCEPLVNTPMELQAISRIHRIGQKDVTTVWMFAIEGTVEENIVALGTRKRLGYLEADVAELAEQDLEMAERDLETAELAFLGSSRVFGNSETVSDEDLREVYFGSQV